MQHTPATLLGQAIGDALGMPFEVPDDSIHPELATWKGGFVAGTYHVLPAGHWTDDTEMAVVLARSLLRNNRYDTLDTAADYLRWLNGDPHGVGSSTRTALRNFEAGVSVNACGMRFDAADQVGSGAAMRAAPLGYLLLRYRTSPLFGKIACKADASITHAHPEAWASSFAVASAVRHALVGRTGLDLIEKILVDFWSLGASSALHRTAVVFRLHEMLHFGVKEHPRDWASSKNVRRGNAWQLTTSALYCAAWASVLESDAFGQGVEEAVRLGGDCDTRAAVVGAVLGACFGVEGIPEALMASVKDAVELRDLDARLYQCFT